MTNEMIRYTNNDTEDVKMRRTKDILLSSGTGVILFAVWGIVRTILNFTLVNKNNNEDLAEVYAGLGEGQNADMIFAISASLAVALLAAEVGLRLFVGLSARAESKGKKKGWAYVVIACIMIPIYIAGIVISIVNIVTVHTGVIDLIVTVIVEVTSLFAFIELVVSATRLKKMKKHQVELNGGEPA